VESCNSSTINRLTHLCLAARVVNLQDTILEGAPPEIRAAVLDKVRKIKNNPNATLGRQLAAEADMEVTEMVLQC
jgi:hypothetical protein